jgi:HPt (histidine-containing phosphotransfer) domain-containing protein
MPPVRSRLAAQARLKPIIRKFVERLRERVAEADAAMAQRNGSAVAEFAHWLKGSAGSMGYDSFYEPALQLEQAAKSGEMDRALALFGEVRSLTARIVPPEEEAATA